MHRDVKVDPDCLMTTCHNVGVKVSSEMCNLCGLYRLEYIAQLKTRSSAIAEGPRDASCQLKSCQLPRNSAETTYTTSPDQIDGMKLEI